jgi:hypothetical protein
MHVITVPQAIIKKDNQMLGRTFFSIMFEGTSVTLSGQINSICHTVRTENDIRDKEDGTGDIVLVSNKAKVFIHSLNLCIPNITSVDMRKEVKNGHDRDEAEVDLRQAAVSNIITHRRGVRAYLSHNLLPSLALILPHKLGIFS